MASHFECLGFPLTPGSTPEELAAVAEKIFDAGEPRGAPEGFRATLWKGPEGAAAFGALAAGADGLVLQCLTPTFLGATRLPARVLRALPDRECCFCDFLHAEVIVRGGRGYPLFLELRDEAYAREMDLRGAEVVLQVNLLAQQVRAYDGREAFERERTEDLAPESLVPTGLLGTPPAARAAVTGEVVAAATLVNSATGAPFVHARLRTIGGEYDLCAASRDLPAGLREGQVVQASCSVIGRVVEGLPAPA